MKFFFDNTMPKRLVVALRILTEDEHQLVSLPDRFRADTPDAEWISELSGEGGWVVISSDMANHP